MDAWRRLLAIGVLLLAGPALAEEFTERVSIADSKLTLHNLVGAVSLESHSGSGYEVEVAVRGEDASRERVTLRQHREGGGTVLHVAFPLGEGRRYVYPEMPRRSNTSFSYGPGDEDRESVMGSILRKLRGKQVRVSGSGRGLEVWADVTVRIPRGGTFELKLGVGEIRSQGVDASVLADSHYGTVDVTGGAGSLVVDTGHGDVVVSDTKGRLRVDTGNGDVDVTSFDGEEVHIDTGNGHVVGAGIRAASVAVDTGNGKIRLEDVSAASVTLDTGNGSVDLELAEMGDGSFVLDSGNGSLTLRLPDDASAEVTAETGHGRVHVDLASADVDMLEKRRDEAHFRVGRGDARVRMDTGNGSVTIHR